MFEFALAIVGLGLAVADGHLGRQTGNVIGEAAGELVGEGVVALQAQGVAAPGERQVEPREQLVPEEAPGDLGRPDLAAQAAQLGPHLQGLQHAGRAVYLRRCLVRLVGRDDQKLVGQLQLRIVHDVLELVREVTHAVLGGDEFGLASGDGGPGSGNFQLAGHLGLGAALLLAVDLPGQGQAPLADLDVTVGEGQFPVDAFQLNQHVHDLAAEVLDRRVATVRGDINLGLVCVQPQVAEQGLSQLDHEVGRVTRRGDEGAVGTQVIEILTDGHRTPGGQLLGDSRADQPVVLHQGAGSAGGQERTDRGIGLVETAPQEPRGVENTFGRQDVRLGNRRREAGHLDVQTVLQGPANGLFERQADLALNNLQLAGKSLKAGRRLLGPGLGLPLPGPVLGQELQARRVHSRLRLVAE